VTFGRWRWRKVRVVVHGCRWTQAASGAAGRANVGLCPSPSLFSAQMSQSVQPIIREFNIIIILLSS